MVLTPFRNGGRGPVTSSLSLSNLFVDRHTVSRSVGKNCILKLKLKLHTANMRCEGIPIDGTATTKCPQNICDNTVKNCQGDLFLCPSCEEFRFPTAAKSAKAKKEKPNKQNTRQTKASQASEDDKTNCSICANSCLGRWLKCSMCLNVYDQKCSNLSLQTFDAIYPFADEFGWVCIDCRGSCSKTIEQLQSAVARMSEQVADLSERVAMGECKCKCSDVPLSTILQTDAKSIPSDIDVTVEVHRVLADKEKRKCNVVVTDLPEQVSSAADEIAFLNLCEENLSTKPALSQLGCRRLGKPSQDSRRPRKLLVHLTSESSAAALLSEAKRLRRSNDSAVASNVYINPDLSPAELQLAFERRQARRAKLAYNRDHTRQRTVAQSQVTLPFLLTSEEFPPINEEQPRGPSASDPSTFVPASSCSSGATAAATTTTAGTFTCSSATASNLSNKSHPYTVVNSSYSSFRNK